MSAPGSNQHVPKTGGRQAVAPEVKQELGARVKELRVKLGRTQEQIADAGGFDRPDMSRFERGDKLSSADNQYVLALGFGVSLDVFYRYLAGKLDVDDVLEAIEASSPEARVRRIARVLGRTDQEADAVATSLAAYKGELTDEMIADRFSAPSRKKVRETVVSDEDDLGTSKLPSRRRR